MTRAYEEVIEFIAAGTTPSNLIAFRPSEEARERVPELIHRKKTVGLSPDEDSELQHYLQLEHIMRLAKARAQLHLSECARPILAQDFVVVRKQSEDIPC